MSGAQSESEEECGVEPPNKWPVKKRIPPVLSGKAAATVKGETEA